MFHFSKRYLVIVFAMLIALPSLHAQAAPLKPFLAHYKSTIRLGWFDVKVRAKRQFSQQSNGTWLLSFQAEASVAKVVETSRMRFVNGRYQPLSYRYRATGLVTDPDRSLNFNAGKKQVIDLEENKVFSSWHEQMQDNVSYMLQASLDLIQGRKELTYPVFERTGTSNFRFAIVAEENLKTDFGTLRTIKIKQLNGSKNRDIHAWLAKDYQYVLVRLQEVNKGRMRYKIELTDLQM